MLRHEVHYGKIGQTGDFASVIELDPGRRLHSGPGCDPPMTKRPRSPSDRGDRVFADRCLDPATLDGLEPFADRHQPNRIRQTRDDLRCIAMTLPTPVRNHYLTLGLAR